MLLFPTPIVLFVPSPSRLSGSNGDMAELLANICHPLADDAEGEDAADFSGASSVGPR